MLTKVAGLLVTLLRRVKILDPEFFQHGDRAAQVKQNESVIRQATAAPSAEEPQPEPFSLESHAHLRQATAAPSAEEPQPEPFSLESHAHLGAHHP